MANNIKSGSNAVVALATATAAFSAAGITTANTAIIYRIAGAQITSYRPERPVNPFSAFEAGMQYYIIAKADFDLTAYVAPPLPTGGSGPDPNAFYVNGSPLQVN